MTFKDIKNIAFVFSLITILSSAGCEKASQEQVKNVDKPAAQPTVIAPPSANSQSKIDVPNLVNKTPVEIDKIFGAPAEAKEVENGGKFRLYKLPDYSKGLAIRFYSDRAKSFNLILDKPFATAKEAILKNLNIDLENAAPVKNATEPLSENYQGTFGGVKFTKVMAKKQQNGDGFIFVLAEAAP